MADGAGEDLGPGLCLVQDGEGRPRSIASHCRVEGEPLGLLLQVEVSDPQGTRQRRLAGLPRPHQGHRGVGAEAAANDPRQRPVESCLE